MPEKMSRWGVGPVFAALSIAYGLIMLVLTFYYYPFFQMQILPYTFFAGVAIVLFLFGLPFFLLSVVSVMRAYNADRLVINGVYRCCRHPLYASWVVFLAPGIALLVNSWLGLTAPVFMYFVLRRLVQKEEIYLENTFGAEYLDYKKKVPRILPYGWVTTI